MCWAGLRTTKAPAPVSVRAPFIWLSLTGPDARPQRSSAESHLTSSPVPVHAIGQPPRWLPGSARVRSTPSSTATRSQPFTRPRASPSGSVDSSPCTSASTSAGPSRTSFCACRTAPCASAKSRPRRRIPASRSWRASPRFCAPLGSSPTRSRRSSTARRWRPTPSSRKPAPSPGSSRREASATCSRSAACGRRISTTSRGKSRRRWCRAGGGSRWTSASPPTAPSCGRSTSAGVVRAAERLAAAGVAGRSRSASSTATRMPPTSRRAERLVRRAVPGVAVSASCAVLPEMKEYERTSTTVVNAYLLPAMRRYLDDLAEGLARIGVRAPAAGRGLERRRGRGAPGGRAPGLRRRLGPGGRRHRRRTAGRGGRRAEPHRLRHGRHDRQGVAGRVRPADAHHRVRVSRGHEHVEPLHQGRRLHAQGPGHRHRRGRDRGRLDRVDRRGRPPAGGAALGGRAAGPRLLRHRRHASRPSRMPTSCWAISTRNASPAAS